jgi:hypothetical protein
MHEYGMGMRNGRGDGGGNRNRRRLVVRDGTVAVPGASDPRHCRDGLRLRTSRPRSARYDPPPDRTVLDSDRTIRRSRRTIRPRIVPSPARIARSALRRRRSWPGRDPSGRGSRRSRLGPHDPGADRVILDRHRALPAPGEQLCFEELRELADKMQARIANRAASPGFLCEGTERPSSRRKPS